MISGGTTASDSRLDVPGRWLTEGVSLPDDVAIVLVHAINPYGLRGSGGSTRTTSTSTLASTQPRCRRTWAPTRCRALVPPTWDPDTQQATASVLVDYATEHGFDGLQEAVSKGQYRHPNGVFYGGNRPVWSQQTLESIARRSLAGAERCAIVDLHTGLGPFGVGELIASHPDGAAKDRLAAWYGDYTLPSEGTSVSADVNGDVLDALDVWVDGREVTGIAVEWGTVDIIEVSNALRADAWLHAHSDPLGPEAGAIKAQLRAAFAPDEPDWSALVWDRFTEVAERTTEGLCH